MKKAQSALEFLMTYGWAFLVILIMIGALAYFGVLNPQKFLPDRCNFGTQISCNTDMVVVNAADAKTVVARLVNGVGQKIKLYNVGVTTPTVSFSACTGCLVDATATACGNAPNIVGTAFANAVDWDNGVPKNIIFSCTGGASLSQGTKVRLDVNGKWAVSGAAETFAKPLSGEIYATVQ